MQQKMNDFLKISGIAFTNRPGTFLMKAARNLRSCN